MINGVIKCPICGHLAKCNYVSDKTELFEQCIHCDHCGYAYEFAYGNCDEFVNNKKFIWNYTLYDNNTQMNRLFKKINKEMFMARRNWKKGITKRKMKRKKERTKQIEDYSG